MPAGTAQPPCGHHWLGHPGATSPVSTGATTETEPGVGQGWGRAVGGQAGATRTCWGSSGCPHLCVTATSLVLPPRCCAQWCGCPSASTSGTCRAAQDGALPGERGQGMNGNSSLWAADPMWCPSPAAGLGVMGAATGMCPPGATARAGCPFQGCLSLPGLSLPPCHTQPCPGLPSHALPVPTSP